MVILEADVWSDAYDIGWLDQWHCVQALPACMHSSRDRQKVDMHRPLDKMEIIWDHRLLRADPGYPA